jgi:UDP-3-O-[3-hydroxymyristoyl] glucosamine N-acyltransferase
LLTLERLALLLNGVRHGNAHYAISNLSSLTRATSSDIAYFDNPLLHSALQTTKAGIVVLKAEHLSWCPVNAIAVVNPLIAIQEIALLLSANQDIHASIDPTAKIHPSARLGEQVSIGPYVVIEQDVSIAAGTSIGAHTVIESSVRIGGQCYIDSNVIIHKNTQLADDVHISSGCILGSLPFNYVKEHGLWQQGIILGGVTLATGVRIGANTVIDRGSVGDTYLAEGVCVDNLVHIAHDAYIGAHTAIAACAVIGAHALVGSDCIIGGASCLAAFTHLAGDVVISGMSTVSKSIAKAGIYSSGTLAHEHHRWRRNAARFRRLDDYISRLNELERKISDNS